MEHVLAMQNPHWQGAKREELLTRSAFSTILANLSLEEIQVLVGVRRSGKSTLFYQVIDHLCQNANPLSILYLNLDDPMFGDAWKDASVLYKIIETAEKTTGARAEYLFLDEVQNIPLWEKFVKSVYDSKRFKKIFVTGSNASLLAGEYATLLSGRHVATRVSPLSYFEVLENRGKGAILQRVADKAPQMRLAEEFMEFGGFPGVFRTEGEAGKRTQLISYFETILLKDCTLGSTISPKEFRNFALYLAKTITGEFSYLSLGKANGVSEHTAEKYVRMMEDGYLFRELRPFSYKAKNTSRKKKIYCLDNGLANVVARASGDKGQKFENLVLTELDKAGYETFFYRENNECDFIVRHPGEKPIAIQAAYDLHERNMERKVAGAIAGREAFNLEKAYIVTMNQEGEEKGVPFLPFWKLDTIF